MVGIVTASSLVYSCGPAGFSSMVTAWSLPSVGPWSDAFDVLSRSTTGQNCSDLFTYYTLDMTADGIPDLVLTDNCDSAGIGTASWRVYAGGPSGFASTATAWSL